MPNHLKALHILKSRTYNLPWAGTWRHQRGCRAFNWKDISSRTKLGVRGHLPRLVGVSRKWRKKKNKQTRKRSGRWPGPFFGKKHAQERVRDTPLVSSCAYGEITRLEEILKSHWQDYMATLSTGFIEFMGGRFQTQTFGCSGFI